MRWAASRLGARLSYSYYNKIAGKLLENSWLFLATRTYRRLDCGMTKYYGAKIQLTDAKSDKSRRFRNILANSGDIMESGEIRDINNLYVMDYDGKLIRIADLATNPEKQPEKYAVKAQADHGELVDGELVPSIEKQFGGCKVWLEDDGLHARMYFADGDKLADHAWSISEFASYSTGIDWFPDGYYGAGYEIEEPIGILREISMVLTGNDPRAKTIDTKSSKVSSGDAVGDNKAKKGKTMPKKTKDALTPDEREALIAKIVDEIDDFTTSAPESETQPTARDTKDEAEGAPKETTDATTETEDKDTKETKDAYTVTKTRPGVLVIRDRVAAQEKTTDSAIKMSDFKKSEKFNDIVRKSLRENGMSLRGIDSVLAKNLKGIMTKDDITGLPALAPAEQIFMSAFAGADGILSHIRTINVKAFRAHAMSLGTGEAGRAHGHKANDEKTNQTLSDAYRDILTKTIYKRNPIDEEMLYENPQLLNYTDEEIDELIRAEIERAIVVSDGRTAPSGNAADYRVFDGTRGIWSIKADAAATSGYGSLVASTITLAAGDNLYTAIVKARGAIKARGRLIVVTKSSTVTELLTSTVSNGYLVQPGTSLEQFLQVGAVYTPEWMDSDSNTAYVFAENQYGLIGETNIVHRNTFDTKYDTEVRMGEIHRGGSLLAAKAAVAIAPAPSTPSKTSSSK